MEKAKIGAIMSENRQTKKAYIEEAMGSGPREKW